MNILIYQLRKTVIIRLISRLNLSNKSPNCNIYLINCDIVTDVCRCVNKDIIQSKLLDFIIENNINVIFTAIHFPYNNMLPDQTKLFLVDKMSLKVIINSVNVIIDNINNIPRKETDLVIKDVSSNDCHVVEKRSVVEKEKKELFRSFCCKYLDYMRQIDLPVIEENGKYEAVLIEYRCLPHLEFLIRNCIIKLGKNWSQTIICGKQNYSNISCVVKKINRNIKIINSHHENLDQSTYSSFLASLEFWNLLVGEKILIYQEDTCIFKSNINDFINYDYIGAPWPKHHNDTPNKVGNGGLSLRTRSKMIEIIRKIGIKETIYNSSTLKYMYQHKLTVPPEDVYFSKNMQELNIGLVADWNTAKLFSCESYFHNNSFGAHGIWVSKTDIHNILYNKVIKQLYRPINWPIEHRGGWSLVTNALKTNNLLNDNKNNSILFYDFLESRFLWKQSVVIDKKWTGVIHLTPDTPKHLNKNNVKRFFNNDKFIKSLETCVCLLTCSTYIKQFLDTELNKIGKKINVYSLKHPTQLDDIKMFSLKLYKKNKSKKIIQVGRQLRKITSIYLLNTSFKKVWLTGTKNIQEMIKDLDSECRQLNINIDKNLAETKYLNSYIEYDNMLSENIVFIDLYDSGANNTVLECIARNTPIIINRTPGVEEYLGKNYPLYFNNLNEVPDLINKIEEGYNYLNNMDKSSFHVNNFIKEFINIINKETSC